MGLVIWRIFLYLNMMSFFLYIPSHGEAAKIRLVGSSRCSGRVEIYHEYRWGTVCDGDWDLNEAEVVCRELNCGTAQSAPGGAYFGQGNDPIWMDDVGCSGSETSLTECLHGGFGEQNCEHNEDAGVVCSGLVRLVDGSGQCSGRVEIYHNNSWGTVCSDHWDLNDAEVVCRELSCGTAQSAPGGAYFGQGYGSIWMDGVGCSGSETSLTECQHRGFGVHNCGHGEAGVVCSGSPIPMIVGRTVGGVLLLLLLLIGLWLIHRRTATKKTDDDTAYVMNASNTVGRGNDEKDEVYVNAEASTCHQGNDDDSDDYVNGNMHADNPREEEEEDEYDDIDEKKEDNYVTVI